MKFELECHLRSFKAFRLEAFCIDIDYFLRMQFLKIPFNSPKLVISLHRYCAFCRLPPFLLSLNRGEISPRMITVHHIGGSFAAHQLKRLYLGRFQS